jgi:hypothetical protein
LRLELIEGGKDFERYLFTFQTYSEVYLDFRVVEGEYWRTMRSPSGSRAPLIVDSPILGGAKDGYLADRLFSKWATKAGLSTFYLHQDADILSAERDAFELDRLLRENIISYRKALDLLLRERPETDPVRLGSFGISLGALKNVVLIAVEPRLKANVLCLAGGNLPRILVESRERMVTRYLERRRARDGLEPEAVAAELRRDLLAEPLLFAKYIPPEAALLFLGTLDDKVPYATGLELREALGRPALRTFPLGHYTGLLAAPFAARRGFAWMKERLGASAEPREAGAVPTPGPRPPTSTLRRPSPALGLPTSVLRLPASGLCLSTEA